MLSWVEHEKNFITSDPDQVPQSMTYDQGLQCFSLNLPSFATHQTVYFQINM